MTEPAVLKSPRKSEAEMDNASSTSTSSFLRRMQRRPLYMNLTAVIMFIAMRRGAGKKNFFMYLLATRPKSRPVYSRLRARALFSGENSASSSPSGSNSSRAAIIPFLSPS